MVLILILAQLFIIKGAVPKFINGQFDKRDQHLVAQVIVERNDAKPFGEPEKAKAIVELRKEQSPRDKYEQIKLE